MAINKNNHEDGNFIDKKEETENKTEEEIHEAEIKAALDDLIITDAKEEGVFPKRKQERSLDHETGGKEKDYDKIEEKTNEDADLWDVKSGGDEEKNLNGSEFESSNYQSFIHKNKLGKGKKRKLGAMTLGKAEAAEQSLSFLDRILKGQKTDPSKDGGGMSR